jgi:hypothetical protein
METKNEIKETDTHAQHPVENPKENPEQDGEFKVTVRKLEMPVRPRGVLAE